MIGLTLNLARRIVGFMEKGNDYSYDRIRDVSNILRVPISNLVDKSYRYVNNAKKKGMPHEPIFEPRKWVRRDKSSSTQLKSKKDGKWKSYHPSEMGDSIFDGLYSPEKGYRTKRQITGKGKRTLIEYLDEQWKQWDKVEGPPTNYDW